MDTKSKKSDKLSIIRFVCVVLSVIFSIITLTKVFGIITWLEENDAYGDAADFFEEFIDGEGLTEDRYFRHTYNVFTETALLKSLLYNEDSKEGYDAYLEKATDKYGEDMIKAILMNETLETDYIIFSALDKGYITLNKIDDIKYDPGNSFHYEKGEGYRVFYKDPYTCFEYHFDDEDEDYYETTSVYPPDGSDSGKNVFTTGRFVYEDYAEECEELLEDDYNSYPIAENSHGAKFNHNVSFPNESKIEKSKADAIVLIKSAYSGDTRYSGVYEVTLNKNALDIFHREQYTGSASFEILTRSEYKEYCKLYSDEIDSYKNAYFAVLDNSTGIFTTNVKIGDLKVTPKTVGDCMSELCSETFVYSTDGNRASGSRISGCVTSIANEVSGVLPQNTGYTVWAGYDPDFTGGVDAFSQLSETKSFFGDELKNAAPMVITGILGWLACLIVLIFITGRRSYDSELHMGRLDKIFTGLRTVLSLGLVALGGFFIFQIAFNFFFFYDSDLEHYVHRLSQGATILIYIIFVLCSLILMDWVLYIARHIKNRTLLKNFSFVMLTVFLIKKSKQKKEQRALRSAEYEAFRKKLMRVAVPVLAVLNIAALITIFCLSDYDEAFLLLIPIIAAIEFFTVKYLLKWVLGINEIFGAIHSMRVGEQNIYVGGQSIPKSIRAYADDVNSVSEGLSIAVENATKEQRTKTELITNVSHDLKTPLTSIINYVDLLSKRPIDDEEAKKYIAVLGEKSEKLKKLIEDLVEASKASAGNIAVNLINISLHELVSQMTGEYEDDFSSRGLTVITEEKDAYITVSADSKLACRVLDNLMVNIKKYAMPGTRVYIKIRREEEYGCIEISNISAQQLNIDASELKERFVRGDESRSTEGSGLGLAIAEDFMNIQGGRLDLSINGDMFTAEVRFKAI